MKFNLGKALWKVFLGVVSTGLGVIAPQVLPQVIPQPIYSLTIGGLVLEILDWVTHKIGSNK
jgi:hypothetical protein